MLGRGILPDTVGEFPTNLRKLPKIPFFGNYAFSVGIPATMVVNVRIPDNRPAASEMRRSAMMDAEQRATTMAIDWKAIATQVGDL
jgi:hypothetical protein